MNLPDIDGRDEFRDPDLRAIAWVLAVAAFVLVCVGVFIADQVVRSR